MSLQICLSCKELGMTWYCDEEDRTWWYCSECEFDIEEDESKECFCTKCNSPLPSASWLIKDGNGFYWCFTCNDRANQVKEGNTDYSALLEEIKKLDS